MIVGRVEPTMSRIETPQAGRSYASSLEIFAQSFLHRAQPKARNPERERGSRPSLSVVAHAVSLPQAPFRHERAGGDQRRCLISSPSGRFVAWSNQRSLLWTSCAGMLGMWRQGRSSVAGTQYLRHTCRVWPCFATVAQRHFTPRPPTGLLTR